MGLNRWSNHEQYQHWGSLLLTHGLRDAQKKNKIGDLSDARVGAARHLKSQMTYDLQTDSVVVIRASNSSKMEPLIIKSDRNAQKQQLTPGIDVTWHYSKDIRKRNGLHHCVRNVYNTEEQLYVGPIKFAQGNQYVQQGGVRGFRGTTCESRHEITSIKS